MLKAAGCEDVKVDFKTKTATVHVPAAVTDDTVTKALSGRYSASVKQ